MTITLNTMEDLKFKSKYRWLIDCGHGALDANGDYTTRDKKMYRFTDVKTEDGEGLVIYEGVVNRQIAARLVSKLSESEIDFNIISAPVQDTILSHRLSIAQQHMDNEANHASGKGGRQCILLSIHNNASQDKTIGPSQKPKGCEIWTSKGEDASDIVADPFAQEYKKKWNKKYGPFRSYTGQKGMEDKEANFFMFNLPLPSLLVECGFYDNKTDALRMIDPAWREDMGEWLFQSILAVEKFDIRWNG